jgi:hypothetical protein
VKWWPKREEKPDRQALLGQLAQAHTVAYGGVGVAGTMLPETTAYYTLLELRDHGLRPDLEQLVANATPAGKVYAARLLAALDQAAGRAAWQRLAADGSPLATMSGCIPARTTLAEYATTHLRNG